MVPVKQLSLTPQQADRLRRWLQEELQKIREKREARQHKWIEWRRQYEGAVRKAKNFPWKGASNVFVPLTGIYVDAIHANMMNRLFGHERIWDVKALHETLVTGVNLKDGQAITWVQLAEAVQEYMEYLGGQQGPMDIYDTMSQALLEEIKLGTAVVHNPWVTLTKEEHVLDPQSGEITRNTPVKIYDGMKPKLIPLEDFLILPHYAEIHGPEASPLVGHYYWLRPGEVANHDAEGWYRRGAMQKVLGLPGGEEEVVKDAQAMDEEEPHTVTDLRREDDYQMADLWLRFPLKEGGVELRLFVTYHEQSNTLMRVHPWLYKTPPYEAMRYVRREGRFYGIGVPEMLETIQKGVNTSFNQAVDNATVANMRCVKVRAGSQLARNFGDIYPGRKFFVDNVDDIKEFQLGEVYPSIFQVGLLLRDFAERRTGISDFNLGRESEVLGRGSTATTTMALLQESARRFDLYSKDTRRSVGELGLQALELVAQMKPWEEVHRVLGEKGELAERALDLPPTESIRQHLIVTATSASSSSNKEVARQNALTAFGLLTQYLERIFQLAGVMVSEQMPPQMRKLAYDMSQTAERLMQRVLGGFDMPDIATLLPQLEGMINGVQQGQTQGGGAVGALGGGAGVPVGPAGGAASVPAGDGGATAGPAGGGPVTGG
jgi:hypothetical protein